MFCAKCGAKISATGRFCSSCGAVADPDTGATVIGDEGDLDGATIGPSSPPARRTPSLPFAPSTPRTPSSSNLLSSSDPIGGAGVTPGQIIGDRYGRGWP